MAIVTTDSIGEQQVAPTCATKSIMVVATDWTDRAGLFCESLEKKVNGWDEATLAYEFGSQLRQPGSSFSTGLQSYPPLDLVGQFVRVNLEPNQVMPAYWYGYILGEDKQRQNDNEGNLVGQTQYFRAVGLAYFLDRKQIRTGFIHDAVEIGRGLVFNGGDNGQILGGDPKQRGNKHPADDSNGLRCFFDTQDTASSADLWSATEILDHVLWYHGPVDSGGTRRPTYYTRGTGVAQFLDDWYPTIRTDGRTPFEVLNALMNPQRGLCWWLEYEDIDGFHATGSIYIYCNSLTPSTINLNQGTSGTLAANSNKHTLIYDEDKLLLGSKIGKPDGRAYTRVVCRGARQTGTGTFGVPDSTLQGNWDASVDEPAYRAGASSTTGYSSLTTEQKAKRNDAMRRQIDFDRVFCSFAVPPNWDGLTGDGAAGVSDAALFPEFTGTTPTGQLTHYWSGLRVMPHLMIAPDGGAPDEDDPEYSRPLVFVQVATSPDRHQFADRLTDADFSAGTPEYTGDQPASYHLYSEEDVFGIRLQSARIAHTLAKGDWSGAEPTLVDPQYNWQTVRCTVSVEGDHHCEGFYPTPPSNVPIEELVIDMGDNYRLDYIVPGTVIGLNEGQDVSAAGGIIRDDRDELSDFARFAYEWYSADRRTLEVRYARIDLTNFDLGAMITTVGQGTGQETINTVIGSVAYDFRGFTTTITTIPDGLSLPDLLS